MSLFSLLGLLGIGVNRIRQPRRHRPVRLNVECLDGRFLPSTLRVGPAQPFHTIQAAVNAANNNDTIKVDAGTYLEQVVIGAGKNGLKLQGANQNSIIRAPAVLSSTGTIVEITAAKKVTVEGFTITGPVNGLNNGIQVDGGGSANITHNHITMISDSPLGGRQDGTGILIGGHEGDGQIGTADIDHNTIDHYQKAGIQVGNAGSSAEIEDNIVTGVGPTAVIAQNGIQVSAGAKARLDDNIVSGNQFTGPDVASTGILIIDAGKVELEDNMVFGNDYGIYVLNGVGIQITGNLVMANNYNGIVLDGSTKSHVSSNWVHFNGSGGETDSGIVLQNSTNNKIFNNHCNLNDGDGLYVDANSTGNEIRNNDFSTNTHLDVEDFSVGSGTAGTANKYKHNKIKTASPAGLVGN